MNRSQVRSQVIENTGRDDDTTRLNNAINRSLGKVSGENLWTDLIEDEETTLAVDSYTLSLASDMQRLLGFTILDGLSSYPLKIRSRVFFQKKFPAYSTGSYSSGKPRFGFVQGNTLYFAPPAGDTYSVLYTYYRTHPDLTADTDSILVPNLDEAVIAYATYLVFKGLQLHEDAAQWRIEYGAMLKDAKDLDKHPLETHLAQMNNDTGHSIPEDYWLDPFCKHVP